MPVDLDVDPASGRLSVGVCDPRCAAHVELVLTGLLSAKFDRPSGRWRLTWPDFLRFREKLDQLGLVDGRTATPGALGWLEDQRALDGAADATKEGLYNAALPGVAALKTELYEDQRTGVAFLLSQPAAILADEMGLGKTVQLLGVFLALRALGQANHVLVLSPNSVKPGWLKEVKKHTALSATALGNGTAQILSDFWAYAQKRTDILVVHFDALVGKRAEPAQPQSLIGRKTRPVPWSVLVDELLRLPWDAIIIDEAHQLKNVDAKRTQAALHLVDAARSEAKTRPRVYLATGTPISETPLDAWAMLKFLNPALLPESYSRFESYFTTKQKKIIGPMGMSAQEIVGYQNLSELKTLLHRLMIRRLKCDVKGLPPKTEQVRYLTLSGAQKKLYDDVKKGAYDAIVADPNDKLSIDFAMTKLIRLRQVLHHPKIVQRDGNSAKYDAVEEILEEVLADPMAKVALWTEWHEAIDLLYARLAPRWGAIRLTGDAKQADITRWSEHWDTMPERLAIGIPAFGGTGIDFLNRCRTAIYLEPPYSTILFRQSMERIHRRVGDIKTPLDKIKASPATLIFLRVENSVDELVYRLLERKGALVDALLIDDVRLQQLGREELLAYLRLGRWVARRDAGRPVFLRLYHGFS